MSSNRHSGESRNPDGGPFHGSYTGLLRTYNSFFFWYTFTSSSQSSWKHLSNALSDEMPEFRLISSELKNPPSFPGQCFACPLFLTLFVCHLTWKCRNDIIQANENSERFIGMDKVVKNWVERAEYDLETAKAMMDAARYLYVASLLSG